MTTRHSESWFVFRATLIGLFSDIRQAVIMAVAPRSFHRELMTAERGCSFWKLATLMLLLVHLKGFPSSFLSCSLTTRFGSGWAWLVVNKEGKLRSGFNCKPKILQSQKSKTPILGLDVWEHAYYVNTACSSLITSGWLSRKNFAGSEVSSCAAAK